MDKENNSVRKYLCQRAELIGAIRLPDNFFDVAVGNVPFDDFKPNDRRYNKNKFVLHDYFFAKTLDKVRPRWNYCFCNEQGNNG